MTLRITRIKAHDPLIPGYVRAYEQCKECKRVYYRDYIPYSLANPILILPCMHGGFGEKHYTKVDRLPEQEGMRLMLGQLEP